MSDDRLSINVTIADRSYRMRILKEDEENVRRSAKEINERLKNLQSRYRASDKQDYLAMAFLYDKVDSLSNDRLSHGHERALDNKLAELDQLLGDFVGQE